MSLSDSANSDSREGFPRVSGDEPQVTELRICATPFSPRERG